MTADENSVIYYILDIIRKQCEEIRIRKESLSQSLILEGRMDVVAMMDVDLGEGWREGNRNLRQFRPMASTSLAKLKRNIFIIENTGNNKRK